jgi:elongation factor P
VVTKQKVDITLKGGDSLPEADFQRRPVKYMYSDPTHMHFLDSTDYNQYAVEMEAIENEAPYITEELEGIMALIYEDQCVGLQLPTTVELQVIECDPGVRGDSATSRSKPAKLETGLMIQVPEYLTQGERVKVDTRTGAFISRA